MSIWDTLGLTATTDLKSIRRAYVRLIKQYHPEDHPEQFREIRDAYEAALRWAESFNAPDDGRFASDRAGDQTLSPEDAPIAEFSSDRHPPPQVLDRFDPAHDISDTLHDRPDGRPTSLSEELPAFIHDGGAEMHGTYSLDPDGADGAGIVQGGLEQIRGYLSKNHQKSACDILERTLGEISRLSDRVALSRGVYEMLADLPDIPMAFIACAADLLDWDIQSVPAMGGSGDGAADLFDTYMALLQLKQSLEEEAPSILKKLRKKQPRPYIAFLSLSESRRTTIQAWVDALSPYSRHFDYLGVDSSAVAAWQDELRRPQFPPKDSVYDGYSFLMSMGYAYYVACSLPWSKRSQGGAWVVICISLFFLMMKLPLARWAGYKWREDWRPNAAGKFKKSLTDLIPFGIMTFFGAIGVFAFQSWVNPGIFALFTFLIFIIGLKTFSVLAIMTLLFNDIYAAEVASMNKLMTWLVLPVLWLKIKLTIVDIWDLKDKAAGWLGFTAVAAICIAIIVFKWPLPF